MFLRETSLRSRGRLPTMARRLSADPRSATARIFLSHSHLDREAALGLKARLGDLGIDLYVDWLDGSMPSKPSKATASRLKSKILACDVFMVLFTANAMASKWVPWEIGIGDQAKTEARVVVVPTESSTGTTQGSEYLDLYQRLEEVDNILKIFKPGERFGTRASEFLARVR